jgi:hypothetical protein
MKKLKDWWRARKRIGMSELGLELLEAMEGEDRWRKTEHTIEHIDSGIQLWIANGSSHYKVYRVPGMGALSDSQKENMLNKRDRKVLWTAYHEMLERDRATPPFTALNILRLARIKAQGEQL